MRYSEAQEIYQTYLEGHRAYPDDEDIWANLQRARAARDLAWERHTVGMDYDIEAGGLIL